VFTDTRRFLAALDPAANQFLFVLILNEGNLKIQRHQASDVTFEAMRFHNRQGHNIFVCVNETGGGQGNTRTRDSVTKFRCVYADDDGKSTAAPYPIPPSIVVETCRQFP
jgi:hypothetical protein